MPGLVRSGDEEDFGNKLEKYDDLTILEVMQLAVETDDKGREKLLKKEQNGKNRDEVIAILRVNWNSAWILMFLVSGFIASSLPIYQ